MDELSKRLPDWVWLNEVAYDSKNIQIRGNALSNNLIADYISNLENSPYFESVNLISSTQKTAQERPVSGILADGRRRQSQEPSPPPPPPAKASERSRKGGRR